MIKIIIKGSLSYFIKKERKEIRDKLAVTISIQNKYTTSSGLISVQTKCEIHYMYGEISTGCRILQQLCLYVRTLPMFLAIKYVNIDKHVIRT